MPSEDSLTVKDIARMEKVDPWVVRQWLTAGRFNWTSGGKIIGAYKTGPANSNPWRIPGWAYERWKADRLKERGQD